MNRPTDFSAIATLNAARASSSVRQIVWLTRFFDLLRQQQLVQADNAVQGIRTLRPVGARSAGKSHLRTTYARNQSYMDGHNIQTGSTWFSKFNDAGELDLHKWMVSIAVATQNVI
jgi:hypothetical protein